MLFKVLLIVNWTEKNVPFNSKQFNKQSRFASLDYNTILFKSDNHEGRILLFKSVIVKMYKNTNMKQKKQKKHVLSNRPHYFVMRYSVIIGSCDIFALGWVKHCITITMEYALLK